MTAAGVDLWLGDKEEAGLDAGGSAEKAAWMAHREERRNRQELGEKERAKGCVLQHPTWL